MTLVPPGLGLLFALLLLGALAAWVLHRGLKNRRALQPMPRRPWAAMSRPRPTVASSSST